MHADTHTMRVLRWDWAFAYRGEHTRENRDLSFLGELIPCGIDADALVVLDGLIQLAGAQGVQVLVDLHLVLGGWSISTAMLEQWSAMRS